MKKFAISCILMLSCCAGLMSQQGWQWLNPQPTGFSCQKIVFTDHQRGFILNSDGDLIQTTDQGSHWEVTRHFNNATLLEIADSTGIISGYLDCFYLSADNGNSWQPLNSPTTSPILAINIVSRDSIFLATGSGIIYKTGDRGKTWTSTDCHHDVKSMAFVNSNIGYVGGTLATILKTTDGGLTWVKKDSVNYIPSGIYSLQFLNKDTGFAFQEYSNLLVTHDGGNTWSSNNTFETAPAMSFVNAQIGYLGGSDGALFRSGDGGTTWVSVTPTNGFKDGYEIESMQFLSPDTGFAVGMLGRILKTTDAGQNWTSYSPTYIPVTSIAFPTTSIGYASTWNNTYRTADGGSSWQQLALTTGTAYGSSSRFAQAHFSSADSGFFLSDNYVMKHTTTDGGLTFTSANPAPYLYGGVPGISFPDKSNGFLYLSADACCGGTIFKSIDGGNSWNQRWTTPYSGEFFSKIFYVDTATAYALRYNMVFKTTDGATSFTSVFDPTYYRDITDIWFVNRSTGFVVDDQGGIFVTHNEGSTWSSVNFPDTYITGINTIRFFNDQIGYLTDGNEFGPTSYGKIYETLDGGMNWHISKNIAGNSIIFTPDSSVVVAGFGGSILKRKIRNYQTDSLNAFPDNTCGERVSVSLGAALSKVDSIRFLVTNANGQTIITSASPDSVVNGWVKCSAIVRNLMAGANYWLKVRFLYDGQYHYSDSIRFTAQGPDRPIIRDSAQTLISPSSIGNQWFWNGLPVDGATQQRYTPGSAGYYSLLVTIDSCISAMSDSVQVFSDCVQPIPVPSIKDTAKVLISSAASGNHWYLNGSAIPGATGQQYTPAAAGSYTVRVIIGNCKSSFSDPVQIDLAAANQVRMGVIIQPNPITDHLTIQNTEGRTLQIRIVSITGKEIFSGSLSAAQTTIASNSFAKGQYVLHITDVHTGETGNFQFMKL